MRAPSTSIEFKNQRFAPAGRAGNALVCSTCGSPLKPKRGSRRQLYCSYRCRDEARRARNFAVSATTLRGSPAIPQLVQNNCVGSTPYEGDFHGRASGIFGPPDVIKIEIIAGRDWKSVVSLDGVACEVARFIAPKTIDAKIRAKADELIAQIPADLSIPNFLRRFLKTDGVPEGLP